MALRFSWHSELLHQFRVGMWIFISLHMMHTWNPTQSMTIVYEVHQGISVPECQISSWRFDTAVSLWSCVCAPSACMRCVRIGQHIAEGHHQRGLPPFGVDCWWAGWARGLMSQADWGQARPRRCCHLAWKGICVCESCSGMRAAHCARYPSLGAVCWAWCCRHLAKSFVWRAQSVHLAAAA